MHAIRLVTLAGFIGWALRFVVIIGLFSVGSFSVRAALKTWVGNGANANWNTSANWSPAGAPANGDDLSFPAGSLQPLNTNNIVNLRVSSIAFSGGAGGYTLRGNSITLTNGLTAANTAGLNTVDLNITNGAAETITATTGGTLSVSGDIVFAGFNLTVNNSFNVNLSGQISGTGNLVKNGTGTLLLNGAAVNTYSGTTTVNAGTLNLNDTGGSMDAMIPGNITIASGATVLLGEGNQIADTAVVTISGTGLFNLNNFNEGIASLIMTGGSVTTGTGTLTNGNITTSISATIASVSGNLSLGNFTRTFTVPDGGASPDLDITANISGGSTGTFPNQFFAGINKGGPGTVDLDGNNTYLGHTTINDGVVRTDSPTGFGGTLAVGSSSPGTTINAGAAIFLVGVDIGPEALTINEPGFSLTASGFSSWGGAVTLNVDTAVSTGTSLAFSNAISGIGGITLGGGGGAVVYRFAGPNPNTFIGSTIVTNGTLELAHSTLNGAIFGNLIIGGGPGIDRVELLSQNQINNDSDVTINANAILNLGGFNDAIFNLTMTAGTVTNGTLPITGTTVTVNAASTSSTLACTVRLLSAGTSVTFTVADGAAATDLLVSGVVTDGDALIKTGAGLMFLTEANTYTGLTTVSGGILDIDNDLSLGGTGNGTTVASGAALRCDLNVTTLIEPLTLNGSGPASDGALQLFFNGTINTNIVLGSASTINVESASWIINGVISGTGPLTKIGAGTLTLGGSSGNTFTGGAFANAGTFQMVKAAGNAVVGLLTIGDGTTAATGRNLDSFQIDSVRVNQDSLWDLNDFNDTVSQITLSEGGDITTGTGIVTLDGSALQDIDVIGPFGTAFSLITGNVNLSGTITIDVDNGASILGFDLAELEIDAVINGAPINFTKSGPGDLLLTATNVYTGVTTINDGEVRINNSFALGSAGQGTAVNGDAELQLLNNINVGVEVLTLNSTASGALASTGGTNSWAGNITLSQTASVNVVNNSQLTLSGAASGAGGITKVGAGTLVLSGASANTYTGSTTVNAGILALDKSIGITAVPGNLLIGDGVGGANADVAAWLNTDQVSDTSAVTIRSSGLLSMPVDDDTIGSLSGAGNIDLGTAGDLTFGTATDTLFSGSISGPSGQFIKQGTGTTTFTGVSTLGAIGGDSIVLEGTLLVNGQITEKPLTVSGPGTLGGTGSVANISVNGNLTPGTSPGILNVSNLTLNASGDYIVELNGPIVGSTYDQVNVHGGVTINTTTLQVVPDFTSPVAAGDQFIIIANDGVDAVLGLLFNGLPEGAIINSGGYSFTISYVGGTGNDVVLTLTAIPAAGGASSVSLGNGNHAIDPDECNFLNLVISNRTGIVMSGVTATLSTPNLAVEISQPYSDYPNVPASGNRTNITPFQISTQPGFVCGTDIKLELIVNTVSHGSFIVPFMLHSGEPALSFSRFDVSIVTNMPDIGTIESTNSVGAISGPISKVAVSLWLTHPVDSDLSISLINPDGIMVDLSSGNGAGANFGSACAPDGSRTTFDDAAATSITAGIPPFVGTFRPESSLAAFINTTASGNWRLRITDSVGGSLGALRCWSLVLYGTSCAAGGGACDFCLPPITGAITNTDLTQVNRHLRDGIGGSCGSPKAWDGFGDTGTNFHYDVYAFTNTTAEEACVTVELQSSSDVMATAYLNSFIPTAISNNFLGDSGYSTSLLPTIRPTFSFSIAAGAKFLIVVNEVSQNTPGNQPYTLRISGLPCPPPQLAITPLTPTNDLVRIHWPTWAGGFKLESLTNLSTTNWVGVTNEPITSNNRYNVTNSALVPTNRFYRLHKP